ncbi:MAG: hypothetical protein GY777_18790 [Candidatus Brocadiaceae bacterium]|nr:hypothetical protein [Candidatus Brocadiaceae bacterium]
MKTLEIIKLIPTWIDAKEPEQFKRELLVAYQDDLTNKTDVYARGTNRFFIIKKQPVKSIKGWLVKRHILNVLEIMDMNHKFKLLNIGEENKLYRKTKSADRNLFAKSTITGTQARSSQWTS